MTSATTVHDPGRVAEDQGIVTPCRDPRYDPDAWFPDANDVAGRARSAAAVGLCARQCPLRVMCRDHAIATRERWGIWGGLTETNRANLRKGKGLRDRQARWLAGQTDHDGNPVVDDDASVA